MKSIQTSEGGKSMLWQEMKMFLNVRGRAVFETQITL